MVDKQKIKKAVYEILEAIGEDPNREGLLQTPQRVADMYEEIFWGLQKTPLEHIKLFHEPEQKGEFVLVKNIPVYSMCEHHLLPFIGLAHIVYIPEQGNIIGLSKLARIVDCYARRPQVQERLTAQIADFILQEVSSKGVAVFIEAEHLCMTMRGAKAIGAKTQTCAFRGRIEKDEKSRTEVMRLLTGGYQTC